MKKIIIKSIVFLLILFLLLIVFSRIVIPKNNTEDAGIPSKFTRKYGILAEPENTIDVIVTGDSESYTSFIPLEAWHKYGYTSYVCGSPAQKLPAVCSILYSALQEQQPKVIMLETNTIYKRTGLTAPLVEIVNKVLPVFEYHDRWKSLNSDDFFGKVEHTKILRDKGYYLRDTIKSGKNEDYMEESEKVAKIPKSNELYVKAIKKVCDNRGIEFVLYSAPSPINWNIKKHNGIEELAKEMGVDYLDLNMIPEEIKIDWTKDTRDKGDHLNHTGSLKTTNYLAKYLSEKNLPDHRKDKDYSAWEKAYKRYMNREIKK